MSKDQQVTRTRTTAEQLTRTQSEQRATAQRRWIAEVVVAAPKAKQAQSGIRDKGVVASGKRTQTPEAAEE